MIQREREFVRLHGIGVIHQSVSIVFLLQRKRKALRPLAVSKFLLLLKVLFCLFKCNYLFLCKVQRFYINYICNTAMNYSFLLHLILPSFLSSFVIFFIYIPYHSVLYPPFNHFLFIFPLFLCIVLYLWNQKLPVEKQILFHDLPQGEIERENFKDLPDWRNISDSFIWLINVSNMKSQRESGISRN